MGIHEKQPGGHVEEVEALLRAVLGESAATEISAREAAFRGGRLPPALDEFVEKVRRDSAAITDGDIARLRANGYSREAGFAPRVHATLALLQKMTERPDDVGRADIDVVRATGVSDAAIADALYVGFTFNLINRLANAFGFDWGDEATARKIAVVLNRVSYRVPDVLLR